VYSWERDYPVQLQAKKPNGESLITIEFSLTQLELAEFRSEIKSNLNGTLPIQVAFGPTDAKITVRKPGPGFKVLSGKSDRIASFVARRIDLEYIPAIRTARSAVNIVEDMVARELAALETEGEYNAALAKVAELQQPILDALSKSIGATLVKFLPAVKSVKVEISQEERYQALRRSCEITIDDGSPTRLEYKGDGVQSLAALGLMRHASDTGARGRNLVIAVEEPESHLHPRAIHEFREVLLDLARKHQVLMTTHNPLFVDRTNIRSNILVRDTRAKPAATVDEIRESLGVRASDNLRHAELVLVVEGEDDRTSLRPILAQMSGRLDAALKSGSLAIDTLAGAANLGYKLGLLRDALCLWHCLLDDDASGRTAFARAQADGLITHAEVHFTTCEGKSEAELEDLYNPSIYEATLKNVYGISLQHPKFRTAKKWSDRLRDVCVGQGKQWTDAVQADVKTRVAQAVALSPENALIQERRAPLEALAVTLEERLSEISSRRR
jgi:hypothetical protein